MPGISDTLIGNMALSHVGNSATIESLTELSVEAAAVNQWYDWSRVQALAAFDWSFARRRQVLASLDIGLADGAWAYRYQYPATCVPDGFRKIWNPAGLDADPVPYVVEVSDTAEVRTILTNMDSATGVFTYDLMTTSLFSAHFVDVLSHLIATRIALSLTGKKSIQTQQLNEYKSALLTAPAHNANEQSEAPPREAEWIRER